MTESKTKQKPILPADLKKHLLREDIFSLVADCAKTLNLPAFLIGGYVRDLLLGRASKDIDFMCIGSGLELAKAVSEKLGKDSEVIFFKNFGTAMIKWRGYELEFVGARKESYRSDSRKPLVEDGTLEDDQNRRDFSINAMALGLNENNFGELIDPFGGVKDLKRKIIRTPLAPDITFSDDPLRMMRAIRFASQLNFDIEPTTFEGISNNAERIQIVSMERISDELNKIILSEVPSYGFKLLYISGLLKYIFPELVELQGVETIQDKSHKDNFYHTLQVLDNVAERSDDDTYRLGIQAREDIAMYIRSRESRQHDIHSYTVATLYRLDRLKISNGS